MFDQKSQSDQINADESSFVEIKEKGICCSNTYLFSNTREFQNTGKLLLQEYRDGLILPATTQVLHGICQLTVQILKKTEETDQQHTISKINMQNELLLGLGNMQVFIALAQYL